MNKPDLLQAALEALRAQEEADRAFSTYTASKPMALKLAENAADLRRAVLARAATEAAGATDSSATGGERLTDERAAYGPKQSPVTFKRVGGSLAVERYSEPDDERVPYEAANKAEVARGGPDNGC